MALPANYSGGLGLLLERLSSGTADAEDQAWAALLLQAAERSIGTRLRRAYVETTEARDWLIYLDVCDELKQADDDDVKRACKVVAGRTRVARERVDSGEEDSHPPMHPATVEKIYEEKRRLEDSPVIREWRRLPPVIQSVTAADHGMLNKLRLEKARTPPSASGTRPVWPTLPPLSPGEIAWLELVREFSEKAAKR